MKQFKISIPKPCHEDWNTMTPKEKGRFCSSCAKTVIDFTKKSNEEVQEYLTTNRGQRVCGHFYRKQLDSIVIQIPETTFSQQLSFQKLFILSLLLVMGTTLFSCKTDTGKVQKIEKVELIDSIAKTEKTIDSIHKDELLGKVAPSEKSCNKDSIKVPPPPPVTSVGVTVIETTGEIEETPIKKTFDVNKVKEVKEEIIEVVEGEIVVGDISAEVPFNPNSNPPKFVGSTEEKFDREIQKFVVKNIETQQELDLEKGRYKIVAKFTIDKEGLIKNITITAPNKYLEERVEKAVEKLPKIEPARQNGRFVEVDYVLPITFVVE